MSAMRISERVHRLREWHLEERRLSPSRSWQRGPQLLDGSQNLGTILRRLQPRWKPLHHTHRAWKRPTFAMPGGDVGLQEIKMFGVVGPQELAAAVRLEPQRKPEEGIHRPAEHALRRKLVLGQPAGLAPQTSPCHQTTVAAGSGVLRLSQMAEHDRALTTPGAPHQHLVREPLHSDQWVPESVSSILRATHQPILPELGSGVRRQLRDANVIGIAGDLGLAAAERFVVPTEPGLVALDMEEELRHRAVRRQQGDRIRYRVVDPLPGIRVVQAGFDQGEFLVEQGLDLSEGGLWQESPGQPGKVGVLDDDLAEQLFIPDQSPYVTGSWTHAAVTFPSVRRIACGSDSSGPPSAHRAQGGERQVNCLGAGAELTHLGEFLVGGVEADLETAKLAVAEDQPDLGAGAS